MIGKNRIRQICRQPAFQGLNHLTNFDLFDDLFGPLKFENKFLPFIHKFFDLANRVSFYFILLIGLGFFKKGDHFGCNVGTAK
ncbi:MAG: hypothetical protein BWY44_00794 [Candidatus Omnitrophica bacterium ADurb.Bin292]|nr:MAG: hypothetical protein BWY44_00794 [Candidatus Omnitrophica bacterium ADurb.Bin292]